MLTLLAVVVLFFALTIALNLLAAAPLMRQGFRPWRSPPTNRPPYAFKSDSLVQFRGGERICWLNASWPASRLTADAEWIAIEGPLRDVWVARNSVQRVRRVRGVTTTGIFFQAKDGSCDGVVFWCRNSTILPQLVSLGWPT